MFRLLTRARPHFSNTFNLNNTTRSITTTTTKMSSSKILTVFGATGNQGGSVINAVLADPSLSKEYKIRAVTRDDTKPQARALADRGVEVVKADMSSLEAAAPAVKDAHTVFFVTNFWEHGSVDTEHAQGKAVTDASKAAGVKHIIFSSLINVTEATGGRLAKVKHFDAKHDNEKYILKSGVPATFVLPGFFMSNFIDMGMLRKNDDGSYGLAFPVDGDKAQIPMFDVVGDTGKFVKAALKETNPSGRHILGASEYITPNQLVNQFAEVTGKKATFSQVPAEVYQSFLPDAIAEELTENMLLLADVGYYAGEDLKPSLELLDEKPTTWKDFVTANKAKFA